MRFCFLPPVQLRNRERVNVKLRNLVAIAHQVDELPFGGRQRRIGHHVQKADMQLADVLLQCITEIQDFQAITSKSGKGRQFIVSYQRHGLDTKIEALHPQRSHRQQEKEMTENTTIESAPMCFACGQDNPIGLQIRFVVEGGECTGRFTPNHHHVGFSDTVHGGIIFSALDDVMANLLYLQNTKAHTARCEIRYRKALRVGQEIVLSSRIESERRRLVTLKGEARLADGGDLIADCSASFMLG